jgi:nucleotide-binding universal stress UspA family protein
MFSKIAVALNDLPESQRALRTAIDLARLCNAELATVSILGDPPAYASFSVVADAGASLAAMLEERRDRQKEMHEKAANLALELGVHATGSIVDGKEVHAILVFLKEKNADLLVLGLHQHDFYLSRLWNSVYDLALESTCSVLGVH